MRSADRSPTRRAARWAVPTVLVVVLAAVCFAWLALGRRTLAPPPPAAVSDTATATAVDSSVGAATRPPGTSTPDTSAATSAATPDTAVAPPPTAVRPVPGPSPTPSPTVPPAAEHPDAWSAALRGLDSSQVRLDAPSLLTVQQVATVWLRIGRHAALPAPRDRRGRATADTVLLVGDSARACLTVPRSWAFAEATAPCRSQLVVPGTENVWRWEVTPGEAQDSVPVSATVIAIIPALGEKEFYSGTVTVRVRVAPCPLYRPDCLLKAASTWQGIVTALGAIAAALTGVRAWLRRRGRPTERETPAPPAPAAPR